MNNQFDCLACGQSNQKLCYSCFLEQANNQQQQNIVEKTQKIASKIDEIQKLPKQIHDFYVETQYADFKVNLLSRRGKFAHKQFKTAMFDESKEAFFQQPIEWVEPKKYMKAGNNVKLTRSFEKKICAELMQNVKFSFPRKYIQVYWDIETYNPRDYTQVPQPHEGGLIACLQMLVVCGQKQTLYLMLNDKTAEKQKEIPENVQVSYHQCSKSMADKFIDMIRQFSEELPTFVVGFNACSDMMLKFSDEEQNDMQKCKKIKGYDLAFINYFTSYILTPIHSTIKAGDSIFQQTLGFYQIRNCYFIDAMPLLMQQLSPEDLKNIESGSLQSYLKVFGCDLKHETLSYVQIQKAFHLGDKNLSLAIEYALQDVIVLHQAFEKRQIFSKIATMQEVTNCSLRFVLGATTNQLLQINVAELCLRHGFTPKYKANPDIQKQESSKGATTFVKQNYILQVIPDVLCHDFAALYPNSIVGNNLCPTTQVKNPQEIFGENWRNEVHIIDVSEDKLGVPELYFLKKHHKVGLMPMLLEKKIQLRNEIKNKQKQFSPDSNEYKYLENVQKAIKVFNNIIYGGSGSIFNAFYNKNFTSAITAASRHALKTLNQTISELYGEDRIIAGDTDSIFWRCDGVVYDKQSFIQVEQDINDGLHQRGLQDNLVVLAEEYITKFCPSKAKKSYYRHEIQLKNFFAGDFSNPKLVIKGVQWSSLNHFARKSIMQLMDEHLKTGQNYQELIADHLQNLNLQMKIALMNKEVDFLEHFSERVKTGGKSSKCQFLRENYNQLASENNYLQCIPLVRSKNQKKSTAIIPLQSINKNHFKLIDATELLNKYQSQIQKFYYETKENVKTKIQNIIEDDEFDAQKMICRVEQIKNGVILRNDIQQLTVQEALELAQNKEKQYSIHEILGMKSKYMRCYFDIDGQEPLDLILFRQRLITCFVNFGVEQEIKMYIASACQEDKQKFSYHITTNIVMHVSVIFLIAEKMKENFPEIDLQVYNKRGQQSIRSLRYLNCVKFAEKDKKPFVIHRKFTTTHPPEKLAITVIDNECHYFELPPILNREKIFKFNNQDNYSFKEERIKKFIEDSYTNFEVTKIQGSKFTLDLKSSDLQCHFCNKQHKGKDLPAAFLCNQTLMFKCFKDQTAKEYRLNVPLDEEELKQQAEKQNKINMDISFEEQFLPTQNQRYVKYNFKHEYELLCVKSAMGTGKTEQLVELLKGYKNGLILSSRIAFSRNAQQRFNFSKDSQGNLTIPTGLDVGLYSDSKGQIQVDQSIQIVQVESITRCSDDVFDILVLDEYQSLYEQLNGSLHQDPNALQQKFIRLLQKAKYILVLDAQLQMSSVKRLEYFSGRQARIEYNIFKPFTKWTVNIRQLKDKDHFDEVLKFAEDLAKQNKKLYMHINSKKKLDITKLSLQKAGFVVRDYHGNNAFYEEEEKVHHAAIKKRDFADVDSAFKQHQIILANSSLGAGVDFNQEHFDQCVSAFFPKSSSPMSFVQSLLRSRQLADNVINLWILHSNDKSATTTEGYWRKAFENEIQKGTGYQNINNHAFNLQVDLKAYNAALRANRTDLIISCLKQLGCQLVFLDDQKQEKHQTKQVDSELPPQKLNEKQLSEVKSIDLSTIKYFFADETKKKSMIENLTNQLPANLELQIQVLAHVMVTQEISAKNIRGDEQIVQFCTQINTAITEKIQKMNKDERSRVIKQYKLVRQFRPIKDCFGILNHLEIDKAEGLVNQKIQRLTDQFKLGIPCKGLTLIQAREYATKYISALKFCKADESGKKQIAEEQFGYKEIKYYYNIYALAGLEMISVFDKKVMGENGKRVNTYKTEIQPLPTCKLSD